MHNLLYVTCNQTYGTTSSQVRKEVYEELDHDASFVGEWGRFFHPLADWFVIGGRWSGVLSQVRWKAGNQQLRDAKEAVVGREVGLPPCPRLLQPAQLAATIDWINQANRRLGDHGQGQQCPRDPHQTYGYEDDAMPVDQLLYDQLLREFAGEWQVISENVTDPSFLDLGWDAVEPVFVGTRWLVVVDYHS